MKLSYELGKIFEQEFTKVIQKEIDDPNYLPQEDFENCMDRAKAMLADAMPSIEKVLAGAIATHRIEHHKEPREEELKVYQENLEPEQLQVTVQGWWVG